MIETWFKNLDVVQLLLLIQFEPTHTKEVIELRLHGSAIPRCSFNLILGPNIYIHNLAI